MALPGVSLLECHPLNHKVMGPFPVRVLQVWSWVQDAYKRQLIDVFDVSFLLSLPYPLSKIIKHVLKRG